MTYISQVPFDNDLLSICVVYHWLRVSFRIAHFAQDGRFARICLADDEDAKSRTFAADFCWAQGPFPEWKGIAR